MPRRNEHFSSRTPFSHHADAHHELSPQPSRTTGPFRSLNPTSAHFHHHHATVSHTPGEPHQKSSRITYKWTSRNNRKGRHAITVSAAALASHEISLAPKITGLSAVLRGLCRMATVYPVWDASYLVAIIFTWGSIVWCVNAFFVFLPLLRPATVFHNEVLYGGGITAFVGATVFEIGSVLLMAEAVNEEKSGCFGWAVESLLVEGESAVKITVKPDVRLCRHHHSEKRSFLRNSIPPALAQDPEKQTIIPSTANSPPYSGSSASSLHAAAPRPQQQQQQQTNSWIWFPSWHALRTHYLHELGFLACLAQLLGATIFWIAGFTALPGIYDHLSPGLVDGVYWTPQVVGGCGFVVSGTLFMLETQKKWYRPAPGVLGWHIGLWNLVGGVGFTLSPCFGYAPQSWAQYQAACSTFWGSWAFLVGSVIQWYESMDKYPAKIEELDA